MPLLKIRLCYRAWIWNIKYQRFFNCFDNLELKRGKDLGIFQSHSYLPFQKHLTQKITWCLFETVTSHGFCLLWWILLDVTSTCQSLKVLSQALSLSFSLFSPKLFFGFLCQLHTKVWNEDLGKDFLRRKYLAKL